MDYSTLTGEYDDSSVEHDVFSNETCATADADLNLSIPCVEVSGSTYQVTLDRYVNPSDSSQFYWILVDCSESADNAECATIDTELNISLPCVEVEGLNFKVFLNRYINHDDPFGLYWILSEGQ